MTNPLRWLWEESIDFLAELQQWANASSAAPASQFPTPDGATNTRSHHPVNPNPNCQKTATTRHEGRIVFVGTDLPFIEPLERLLEEVWSYLKAQEPLIADETQALQALQEKMATSQRWVQFYENSSPLLQSSTSDNGQFDRNRHRCYRQELTMYQQLYQLKREKIDQLNSNRIAVSMMLDNLRSELLKIDFYHTSIDRRLGLTTTNTVYTEADLQVLIDAFTHKFKAAKVLESRTIARFNQELEQLTKTWKTTGFA